MSSVKIGNYLVQQEATCEGFKVYELIDLPETAVLGGIYGKVQAVKNRRLIATCLKFRDAKTIAAAMQMVAAVKEHVA
jgi:hypothetical protein